MNILTSCIIGFVIAAIGFILRMYPPKEINNSIGYKTPFAMKNKNTWNEGNRFCGLMLIFTGFIFTALSIAIKYFYIDTTANLSIFILFILFILSILLTEIHLRNLFDKNGVKKI